MYDFANKELGQKIKKAEICGEYLITITRKEPRGRLEHWWGTRNFPRSDIMPTLEHIKEDIKKEAHQEKITEKWR